MKAIRGEHDRHEGGSAGEEDAKQPAAPHFPASWEADVRGKVEIIEGKISEHRAGPGGGERCAKKQATAGGREVRQSASGTPSRTSSSSPSRTSGTSSSSNADADLTA